MQANRVAALHALADDVIAYYRKHRTGGRRAKCVHDVRPLSSGIGAIVFEQESGTLSVVVAYWLDFGGGRGEWRYFFPTEAHLRGLLRVQDVLDEIDDKNFEIKTERGNKNE